MKLRDSLMMMTVLFASWIDGRDAAAQDPQPPPPPQQQQQMTAGEADALRNEVEELRFRQKQLELRLDAQRRPPPPPEPSPGREAPPPPAPLTSGPRFHFGRDGFAFGTADGKNEIRFHAVFHFDAHAYFGDKQPAPDTFFVRRARPFVDGTLFGIVDFRLMPDLAPGQPVIADAYLELHPRPWLRIRAGRFRVPIGLEYLERDSGLALVERSLVTDLVPFRDYGVMILGDIAGGTLEYQAAILNGAADMANGPDTALQSSKDYVGRLFLRPLKPWKRAAISDLGFGIAASYGDPHGTAAATGLATYKSTSLLSVFSYLPATTAIPSAMAAATPAVLAAGLRWRLAPQLEWYIGPFALLAEYVLSSQRVQHAQAFEQLTDQAWNLTARFVLTMERASSDRIQVRHPVDFQSWNMGAWELTARYSELRLDPNAFPTFADPNVSVRNVRELGVGLNWHLTSYTKLMFAFERSDFTGGAAMGYNRMPESALLMRMQVGL
ncbi:MAG TPA: porin [Polyangia bacterium]|nr:porin [Polyangia bacterium]